MTCVFLNFYTNRLILAACERLIDDDNAVLINDWT